MKIKFICLASGSSGNCFYLGTSSYGILIDAGIGVRVIRKALKEKNIALENILGVFVTHDHADHIKSVGVLGEKYQIPVYATEVVHSGMNRSYCMTEKLSPVNKRLLQKDEVLQLRDFFITPFEIPHDGSDNVGYYIECDGKTFCFITDIGHITPTAANYIQKANYLILEANYDEEMLRSGSYPYHLKERISSPTGHLSNQEAADYLATNFPEDVQYIWLCHLSKENNHPELAYKTVEMALQSIGKTAGKDVELISLKRTVASDVYEFE